MIADRTTFAFDEPAQQIRQETEERVDAHLLIRPVILGAHCQVDDILELPKGRLRVALPLIGQDNLCSRPRLLIRHEQAFPKHFGFERVQGLLIERPLKTVGPFAPRMIGNLQHVLEYWPDCKAATRCCALAALRVP